MDQRENLHTGKQVVLLFSKSRVYIHPTNSAKDNIPGFLAIVKPPKASNNDILISWIPEETLMKKDEYDSYVKVDLISDTDNSTNNNLLTNEVLVSQPSNMAISSYAFAIPISDLYSIIVRPPFVGLWWGSLIFNCKTSDTYPALFFHDDESQSTILLQKERNKRFETYMKNPETGSAVFWGGEQFISELKKYSTIQKSTIDSKLFLINPDSSDILSLCSPNLKVKNNNQPFFKKFIKDAQWTILEKLSRVTNFSKRAAHDIVENSPPPVKSLLLKPEVKRIGDEFDSARVYLAKWAMALAEEAEKNKKIIIVSDHSTSVPSSLGDFEFLNCDEKIERRSPVSLNEWDSFFDQTNGELRFTINEVKEKIFHGGLTNDARSKAWLFLLGVVDWSSSEKERIAILSSKRDEYFLLKRKWWDDIQKQNNSFWKDQKLRIEKDVHRTDRNIEVFSGENIPHPDPSSSFADIGTNLHLEQMKVILITYNEYNKNLGYVQGMSDLLAPLYVVFGDDAIAFWAFTAFMDRMERNFLRDQSGMKDQLLTLAELVMFMEPKLYEHLEKAGATNLFFFFRMILVWFKREFPWDDVLRLWEVLWTDFLSSQFHLFVALAILCTHKNIIIENLKYFDEILKYMNDLSMHLNLEDILKKAEALFYRFRRTVELIDLKLKKEESKENDDGEGSSPQLKERLPTVTRNLRRLLSKEVIVVHEVERPEGATGG